MKKLALAAGCLLLALAPAACGTPAALTNKDVLVLIEAGLPAPAIVAKIETSRTDFDTSADQLVKLSKAGANASVLEAMIRAGPVARHREYLDWRTVPCNDEASVQRHLDTYPNGRYQQAAQNCLANIEEAWREVQCGDVASVESFLATYPGGRHEHPGGRYEQRAKDCLAAIAAKRQTEIKQSREVLLRDCPQCPELVVVPAGTFKMGSPASEEGRDDDEGPQHRVTIAKPFAVGKYEVTFAEWDTCLRAGDCAHNPDDQGWGRGNRPVIDVSWRDVQQYLAWLSRKTGKPYRLLSESEWEYAARAETSGPFHFGDMISIDQANYGAMYSNDNAYRGRTVAVGSFPANNFGLHDMHGNVREWVEDCGHSSYVGAPSDGDAWTGSGDCDQRVVRDGSWNDSMGWLRSAARNLHTYARNRHDEIGFRVARTLTP